MPATLAVMEIASSEPTTIRAGDSAAWVRDLPEYSAADGWALKYKLLWTAGVAADIASTAVGTRHSVSLTAAATASYISGTATLVGYVERTVLAVVERVTLQTGALTILPNLVTAANHDARSANRIALDNAREALASYMAKGQLHVSEFDIGGRRMKFRASSEIIDLIQHYEREVAKENAVIAAMNGVAAGRVRVRF